MANNIAITLAGSENDGDRKSDLLERVMESAEANGDFYNGARAIVRMMKVRSLDEDVTQEQLTRLIRAYQHLHNERGAALFDDSHEALWSAFRQAGEEANMLRLFRHSSLIWRLRGHDDRETAFRAELASFVASPAAAAPDLSLEVDYYRARVAAALERQDAAGPALPSS